jgi:hypothetical protein
MQAFAPLGKSGDKWPLPVRLQPGKQERLRHAADLIVKTQDFDRHGRARLSARRQRRTASAMSGIDGKPAAPHTFYSSIISEKKFKVRKIFRDT